MFFFFFQKSHQRQHNKDKPFKCSNCFRAYSDSASLQIHLSAHAIKNAKAFCCSMCGRAYTSVSPAPFLLLFGALKRAQVECKGVVFLFSPGDIPYEAHVQTRHGGACCVPPLPPAQDWLAHHSYTDFPHLSPTPTLLSDSKGPFHSNIRFKFMPVLGKEVLLSTAASFESFNGIIQRWFQHFQAWEWQAEYFILFYFVCDLTENIVLLQAATERTFLNFYRSLLYTPLFSPFNSWQRSYMAAIISLPLPDGKI